MPTFANNMNPSIMTDAVLLRDATEADLSAIRDIYNHAVEHTTAIWNETLVDLENRQEWMRARKARGFPIIVAELSGKVAGYASYGDWRPFDGYRHTVEHSVYVDKDCRGAGIGRRLMRELIARAAAGNIHVMIAGIEAENVASIRLHEKLGFRIVGRFSEVGTKFGRWLDLTCMELRLPGKAD
ncbi:N-acetyltransferase [Rhizobium laguerreae]|uniref:GNAT family N-acetyltransferase n=1 Tax=Rhizobium laguerreae TaxID=1076926 RepID=UPI00143F3420|nr:GNAT family N-acetyltransferase [Rhizobium laguerreae]MBN9984103.1 N-acetyltransferase family protein [Rhizobium laguerreae]MBY3103416.1 N-acetyltransferase [Rhizobium laguerreae]MBY3248650.1 N-acetyltransferase [Rhizobium laguerreae]MBY3315469.1 N-acetyltransferase [Rhizobium laguerreae]MBY3357481.1 N-acetyltransferase [Rhizobium laguerreae]